MLLGAALKAALKDVPKISSFTEYTQELSACLQDDDLTPLRILRKLQNNRHSEKYKVQAWVDSTGTPIPKFVWNRDTNIRFTKCLAQSHDVQAQMTDQARAEDVAERYNSSLTEKYETTTEVDEHSLTWMHCFRHINNHGGHEWRPPKPKTARTTYISERAAVAFAELARLTPDEACSCCTQLCFPNNLKRLTKKKMAIQSKDLLDTFQIFDCKCDYEFCPTCIFALRQGYKPTHCELTGARFPPLPDIRVKARTADEVDRFYPWSELTEFECRLIAPCIAFGNFRELQGYRDKKNWHHTERLGPGLRGAIVQFQRRRLLCSRCYLGIGMS